MYSLKRPLKTAYNKTANRLTQCKSLPLSADTTFPCGRAARKENTSVSVLSLYKSIWDFTLSAVTELQTWPTLLRSFVEAVRLSRGGHESDAIQCSQVQNCSTSECIYHKPQCCTAVLLFSSLFWGGSADPDMIETIFFPYNLRLSFSFCSLSSDIQN